MTTPVIPADDNVIQPFQLDASNLRGRMVRVGDVLHNILQAHDYPEPVAHLLAETVTLCSLLSSMLKYEGIFTLQAQGDGPVQMLVSDITSEGMLRGCASFDEERVLQVLESMKALNKIKGSDNYLAQLLGAGYIAFTVDQGDKAERYQGIVELKGSSIVDCVQHYFEQSEQIGTGIKISVGKRDGLWRSGGIMLQNLPEDNVNSEAGMSNADEDDWRRSMILLGSSRDEELLDPDLHSNTLLRRLFHEEEVRVYEASAVFKGCRCDEDRVKNMIMTMPQEDRDYMAKEGEIKMRCEFCSHEYVFSADSIASLDTSAKT